VIRWRNLSTRPSAIEHSSLPKAKQQAVCSQEQRCPSSLCSGPQNSLLSPVTDKDTELHKGQELPAPSSKLGLG
jgi:hypothetical protein